jgi:A/G-specific adenine glycosylase
LLLLPGVGHYIARSICAAAFGQRKGVLDTNIIRILERCFGIRSSRRRPREDAAMWELVNRLVPPRTLAEPAEWNWALLDFAASLCTHYKPACALCVAAHLRKCRSSSS